MFIITSLINRLNVLTVIDFVNRILLARKIKCFVLFTADSLLISSPDLLKNFPDEQPSPRVVPGK